MAIHTMKARAFIVNLTIISAESGRMAIHKSSILYWEKRVYMIEKIKGLMKKYQEMIAYLIVGGLTTLVSWGAMYLVSWLLFDNPLHPYTKALLSAIPSTDIHNRRERIMLKGEITSPVNPKPGCRFAARCPYVKEECYQPQELVEIKPDHFVSCCRCKKVE